MKSSHFNQILISLFIILIQINFVRDTISDDYETNTLEEGDYDIMEFNDYHNLKLIITSSKRIYKGIPPQYYFTTTANLINATSFISINEKFLLGACAQDNLLIKVKISDGATSSVINYNYFNDLQLQAPTTTCSLSIINNTIFIGYTRIDYYETETNKTNIIFKFTLKNLDDENGPDFDQEKEKKYFIFPESTIKTNSKRQISCEPLKIMNFDLSIHTGNDYRLLCIHEAFYFHDSGEFKYQVYSSFINDDFNGFDGEMRAHSIYRSNENLGFKLYKINNTYARCVMKKAVYDIYLNLKIEDGVQILDPKYHKPKNLNNFNANMDLFDYNNNLLFSSEKVNAVNAIDIYNFGIYFVNSANYFKLFDYRENNIKNILGYFDETKSQNNILFVYKNQTYIKYFTLTKQNPILDITPFTFEYQVVSNEQKTHNFNENTEIANIGEIHIESISRNNSGTISTEKFPINFRSLLIENNSFTSEKSLNTWFKYTFAFIETNDNYDKMYYLGNSKIEILTCYKSSCPSCTNFNQCDGEYGECPNENQAPLIDSPGNCYNTDKLVKGYKYNSDNNLFEKCYKSCDFCSEISEDISSHKCESCADGYLPSYKYPGNCYGINSLGTTEDKVVNVINDENYSSSSCNSYKIESTGECVDNCYSSTPFFSFVYNSNDDTYIRTDLSPPKYSFNNICYDSCPENTIPDNDICKCEFAFFVENQHTTCFTNEICLTKYPYQNPETKECYSSLEDCLEKGNNFFFNKECYKEGCPNEKVALNTKSEEIKNYFKNNLLLNDHLQNKLCICDLSDVNTYKVWSNISSNEQYFQDCLDICPNGYIPESLTNQCLVQPPTTIIKTLPETTVITTLPETIFTTLPETSILTTFPETTIFTHLPEATIITTIFSILPQTQIRTTLPEEASNTDLEKDTNFPTPNSGKDFEIIIPEEYYKNQDNCLVVYENQCYQRCPDGTCLTQDDPSLITCIPVPSTAKIYNNICFMNLEEITKNIKSMSENNEVISQSGIIIRGYSSKSNQVEEDEEYSTVDLGLCEDRIKQYYHLQDDTELFILGIDSPNKDKSYTTNVYNYGVYLDNGTLLDHTEACKDTTISVSSVITNTDLIKLDEASYFNDLGYDIYNESSNFYTDICSPASINGNDVTLSDRKKDFYPSNISLCNTSCHYSSVNYNSKRFTCECETNYNYSNNNNIDFNSDEEDNSSYLDYFLSLINYKIGVCYKLFFDFKSYYYNAGFYIAVGTLVFCVSTMAIFLSFGIKDINLIILENSPNKKKLIEAFKEQRQKQNDLLMGKKSGPPLKKYKDNESSDNLKNGQFNSNYNIKRRSQKGKSNQFLDRIKRNSISFYSQITLLSNNKNSPNKLKKKNKKESNTKNCKNENNTINRKTSEKCNFLINVKGGKIEKRKIIKDEYGLISYVSDEQIDKKEYNSIPYTQALRIDKRGYYEIFLSVLAHEIKIIDIFYYKNQYSHLSLVLSIYVFELCLDLTLNCILYTDDVVSEKYNNNGSIGFFTSLSLSFISNIVAGIIAFIVGKLADYSDVFELMLKEAVTKRNYLLTMIKFKKYLTIKLTGFFIIQNIINLGMCYYLMIFCTIYHKTQGSIMLNYLLGIAESMAISFGLAIITSIFRYVGLQYKWRSIYYTSKYFFENF